MAQRNVAPSLTLTGRRTVACARPPRNVSEFKAMTKLRLSRVLARLGLRRKPAERMVAGPILKMARRYEAQTSEQSEG